MIIEYPFYQIVVPLIKFAVLFAVLYGLFSWIFPRFRNIRLRYKVAFLTGLTHFILLTYLCIIVAINIETEGEIGMIFAEWAFYDFPFFFIFMWLDNFLRDIVGYNVSNALFPFIAFGILGSSAYAFLGFIIGKIIETIKTRRSA